MRSEEWKLGKSTTAGGDGQSTGEGDAHYECDDGEFAGHLEQLANRAFPSQHHDRADNRRDRADTCSEGQSRGDHRAGALPQLYFRHADDRSGASSYVSDPAV